MTTKAENIHGEFLEKESGEKIFLLHSPSKLVKTYGHVIIVPPYGRNAHNSVFLTQYLVQNGFDVTRFDPRFSVGRSTGNVEKYKLSVVQQDLMTVIEHIEDSLNVPLCILTMSLSSPVAWRVANKVPKIQSVVTTVGVIDIVDTVEKAAKDELFLSERCEMYRRGELFDPSHTMMTEVLGLDIYGQEFVADLVNNDFCNASSVLEDIKSLQIPTHMIFAGNDKWVRPDLVEQAKQLSLKGSQNIVIPDLPHDFGGNAVAAKRICEKIVKLILQEFCQEYEVTPFFPRVVDIVRSASVEAKYISKMIC
ncbi:hypothetical protein [Marinimicrobium locisalis]|uniref:hypothetical protein n=1 Tax=Marinimicrobium locisalis TaxID=546022 RepID=UPI003221607D